MIKLETAVALKAAGLKWEPMKGDWWGKYYTSFEREGRFLIVSEYEAEQNTPRDGVWLPRLDQLLAEIEGKKAHMGVNG